MVKNDDKNIQSDSKDSDEDEDEDQLTINYTNLSPSIYQKTLELLKHNSLCFECLGRQFSYLGTATSNTDRAHAILLGITMECHFALQKTTFQERFIIFKKTPIEILQLLALHTSFIPAKKVLEQLKEKKYLFLSTQDSFKDDSFKRCKLCENILLPEGINEICKKIDEKCHGYDFINFLIGTHLNPAQAEREDEYRVKFNLRNGESFKANLNRLIGKKLQQMWQKTTKFENPGLLITIDLKEKANFEINLRSQPLFIKGQYKKWVRDLPQTHWHCSACRGKGIDKFTKKICNECGGTGDKYPSSIQDLIGEVLIEESKGESALFHGAGREDMDARCLGIGRPFIIEIKNPKFRKLDLENITHILNDKNKAQIHVSSLMFSNKKDVVKIKSTSEFTKKKYNVLIYFSQPFSQEEFEEKLKNLKEKLENSIVYQRTPLRVVHRRADKTRKKKIYSIQGKFLDPRHGFFKICTQGGTYIKELIHGDNNRTNPSFAQIFGYPMICEELDVVQIEEIEKN